MPSSVKKQAEYQKTAYYKRRRIKLHKTSAFHPLLLHRRHWYRHKLHIGIKAYRTQLHGSRILCRQKIFIGGLSSLFIQNYKQIKLRFIQNYFIRNLQFIQSLNMVNLQFLQYFGKRGQKIRSFLFSIEIFFVPIPYGTPLQHPIYSVCRKRLPRIIE